MEGPAWRRRRAWTRCEGLQGTWFGAWFLQNRKASQKNKNIHTYCTCQICIP
ncbi:hypothetical protein SETIT_4G280100v2 [Setaria italica]|uniref:Uncharacterized protein n=2 Tax=Setaria TaxID=4554 RepID=A0A368QZ28_SETIT|nr:hypothetical protein SETIT_4G280100v2 [Setaria italica]TKW23434.1 hypothetical protein SEVIR_4G291900v2 [Setaria viridis]